MPHPATLAPETLLAQCDVRFTRRSGPGGQNRNKVETAAVLTHRPTGLSAEANERRSQSENRAVALARLRTRLAIELRSEGPADRPSELWLARCHGGRLRVSPAHEDFPALLAEAFDALAHHAWEPRDAAASLGCSASQLVKLVADEPSALARLNRERAGLGRHPMR